MLCEFEQDPLSVFKSSFVKVFQCMYGRHNRNGVLYPLPVDSAIMDGADAMLPRCHVAADQIHALGN